MIKMLTTVYPSISWAPWKFSDVPDGFWDNTENVRACVRWIEEKIGIKKHEEWYDASVDILVSLGMSRDRITFSTPLLSLNCISTSYPFFWIFCLHFLGLVRLLETFGSLLNVLSVAYPDYKWLPWYLRSS